MKIIREAHRYELENFDQPHFPGQILQFIEKVPGGDGKPMITVCDGTTNEDVLRVLINRITKLNAKHPCAENGMVIHILQAALSWLNRRTSRRKARGVEGTNLS